MLHLWLFGSFRWDHVTFTGQTLMLSLWGTLVCAGIKKQKVCGLFSDDEWWLAFRPPVQTRFSTRLELRLDGTTWQAFVFFLFMWVTRNEMVRKAIPLHHHTVIPLCLLRHVTGSVEDFLIIWPQMSRPEESHQEKGWEIKGAEDHSWCVI